MNSASNCVRLFLQCSLLLCVVLFSACTPVTVATESGEVVRHSHIIDGTTEKRTFPVTVTGRGVSPNSGYIERDLLMADRAATIDAYRNLSERISGLLVESYSRQGQFIANKDVILSETSSYIRGARVMDVIHASGISTATVRINLPIARFNWYYNNQKLLAEGHDDWGEL